MRMQSASREHFQVSSSLCWQWQACLGNVLPPLQYWLCSRVKRLENFGQWVSDYSFLLMWNWKFNGETYYQPKSVLISLLNLSIIYWSMSQQPGSRPGSYLSELLCRASAIARRGWRSSSCRCSSATQDSEMDGVLVKFWTCFRSFKQILAEHILKWPIIKDEQLKWLIMKDAWQQPGS